MGSGIGCQDAQNLDWTRVGVKKFATLVSGCYVRAVAR